jgi:hypothetical protein
MKTFARLRRLFVAVTIVYLPVSPAMAQTGAAKVTAAANAFLGSLDDKQRQSVIYAFDDDQQRRRWSNFPTGFIPRGGVSLRSMTPAQRVAAMTLLSNVLSTRGYEKVQQIMQADEVTKINEEKNPGGPPGRRNGPPDGQQRNGPPPGPPPGAIRGPVSAADMFGEDLYYISFLGRPSEKDPWMLQFGGHHLALNITIAGERGVLTPTLTGAQPALFTLGGKTIRPLGNESDKALALLNALDAEQRKQAILSYRVSDLVLGPGQDGKTIQPEGLKASAMTAEQRAMLLDLISEWAGIIDDATATARMAEIKADLDSTWFAWSGPTAAAAGSNITAYYRIQGPTVVIEYAPQELGGDLALHVHTMYRDPTNDYGRTLIAK